MAALFRDPFVPEPPTTTQGKSSSRTSEFQKSGGNRSQFEEDRVSSPLPLLLTAENGANHGKAESPPRTGMHAGSLLRLHSHLNKDETDETTRRAHEPKDTKRRAHFAGRTASTEDAALVDGLISGCSIDDSDDPDFDAPKTEQFSDRQRVNRDIPNKKKRGSAANRNGTRNSTRNTSSGSLRSQRRNATGDSAQLTKRISAVLESGRISDVSVETSSFCRDIWDCGAHYSKCRQPQFFPRDEPMEKDL